MKLYFLSKKENYSELLGMGIQNWTTFITTLASFFFSPYFELLGICAVIPMTCL